MNRDIAGGSLGRQCACKPSFADPITAEGASKHWEAGARVCSERAFEWLDAVLKS
jgi:hypothetical protein